MSDSDNYDELHPPPKRQKRFTFKTFAQRVSEVDVDVYRRLATVRAEPLPGSSSFLQEELTKWRELNSAADFLDVARSVNPLVQTLPQLLHHKDQVADILLRSLHIGALLSLDAILALLAALSRDLQADFVPYVPRVATSLADLIEEGGDRQPELLEHVFTCLSSICKHLVKPLSADLPRVLQQTGRLRYSGVEYVRALAAQSVGFLFRHASVPALRSGVRALLAEHALRPSEERTDGAGHLLAESVSSIANGLHSRARLVLELVLQEDLLSPDDFKSNKDNRAVPGLTAEVLRARAAAVASAALHHLLEHVRRGKCAMLWDAVLHEAYSRVGDFEAAFQEGDTSSQCREARIRVARGVAAVAQLVEFHRGSRVEDYQPLLELAGRLAIVYGHSKDVGASEGFSALSRVAPTWSLAFSAPPPAERLPFIRALITPPGGGLPVARLFGPQMLAGVGQVVLGSKGAQELEAALPLLLDICAALRPVGAVGFGGVPVILTAQQIGVQLAAHCAPHACENASQMAELCDKLMRAAEAARGDPSIAQDALFLYCQAAQQKATVLLSHDKPALHAMVPGCLDVLRAHPTSYQAIVMAGEVASAAKDAGMALPVSKLKALLPLLQANLAHPAQPLRRATLRLLCCYEQPPLPLNTDADQPAQRSSKASKAGKAGKPSKADQPGGSGGPLGSSAADPNAKRSEIFECWLHIESQTCSIENGRQAAVTIGRMSSQIEYGRVPQSQIEPLVLSLLGAMHIRFSMLWKPCADAVGMALAKHAASAWPLILSQLTAAQAAFLAGERKASHSPPPAAECEPEEVVLTLLERYSAALAAGSAAAGGGSTDASVRLAHLIKAMAAAPSHIMEARSKEWVPVFLAYIHAKTVRDEAQQEQDASACHPTDQLDHTDHPDEQAAAAAPAEEDADIGDAAVDPAGDNGGDGEAAVGMRVGAKAWRAHLKEWLGFAAGIKGSRGMHRADDVQRAVALQLMDMEPGVQQAALQCLKVFKLPYLTPAIMERLLRLASDATLREELTGFPLPADVEGAIPAEHRAGAIPVMVRLLWPKMRKRSGRLAGKGAPGSARAAILNFLAGLEALELRPLVELFLQPVSTAFIGAAGPSTSVVGLFDQPCWVAHTGAQDGDWWFAHLDRQALANLPLRQKLGFLNAADDLLKHLGHKLLPYLPEMLAILLCLLEHANAPLLGAAEQRALPAAPAVPAPGAVQGDQHAEQGAAARQPGQEGGKEVRALSLRLVAQMLERFPDGCDFNVFWPRFFPVVEPLMARLPVEVSADRAPPLLECAAAMAASRHLAGVLADRPSLRGEPGDAPPGADKAPGSWAAGQSLGSRLMQSVIAALAAPNCAEPSRQASLGVIESLLDLDEPSHTLILLPHTEALLEALKAIVATVGGSAGAGTQRGKNAKLLRKTGQGGGQPSGPKRGTAMRALAVLERLAEHVGDAAVGGKLADALLPLLQQKPNKRAKASNDELVAIRTLHVLATVWTRLATAEAGPVAPEPVLWRYVEVLAPQAGSLSSQEARKSLGLALKALAGLLPALEASANLVADLNAMSTREVDELDYDARLAAYAQLLPSTWAGFGRLEALPLLHHCLHDLRNADDLALRHAAAQALARFVEAAAGAAGAAGAAREWTVKASPGAGDGRPEDGLVVLVQRVLFPQIKKALASSNLAVRQEHVGLLRSLVLTFPAWFADLQALTDADPEVDFFNNVAHLQLHRRSRALQRLSKVIRAGEGQAGLSVSSLLGIAMPLLQQFIVEGKGAEASGHEMKEIDRDREANVVDAAVTALGAVARQLPWVQYQQLLNQFLRIMKRLADSSKAIIRAVCAIIDAFHFTLPPKDPPADEAALPSAAAKPALAATAAQALPPPPTADASPDEPDEDQDQDQDQTDEDATGAALALTPQGPAMDTASAEEVQSALVRRVLPALQEQLIRDGEVVRAPVALAMVKLLKLLPRKAERLALPKVLQGVANLLRQRLQRIRDDARSILVAMVAELGSEYLSFALQVLSAALPARGYTAHVLGYTVHAVLDSLAKGAEAGALDDCLQQVLPLMEADLFGDVADAKEAAEFAGAYKEAKKCRAYDTYQLLARMVTFRTHIGLLLSSVRVHLGEASNPKIRAKLAQMLQSAVRGIQANPSAGPEDVLVFVHSALEGGLAAEEDAQAAARQKAEAALRRDDKPAEVDAAALHEHMLVEFALTLLHSGLKKGSLGGRSPQALAMLDPLLPLLVRAMKSRHATSVSLALRSLAFLVPLALPGLPRAGPEAGKGITSLLQRITKTSHPIAQDCFKLLAALLRECRAYKPTTPQLRYLLGWAFTDLEEAEGRQTAFSLLKAILGRKLVVPEVYDLMGKVQELMIKSQSASIRQLCSSVFLQFLLDYPLGEKRLQQHLQFIVTNLAYEHESGREAALDMLQTVIVKFPDALVDQWAEVFFLPLVTRLVNDQSNKCRASVGAAIKTLLQRVGPVQLDKLAQYCVEWLGVQDTRLRRAAAQTLGFLVEVEREKVARRVPEVLARLLPLLQSHSAASAHSSSTAADDDGDNEYPAVAKSWQEAYYGLLFVEKVLASAPAQVGWQAGETVRQLWQAVSALLLHRHLWVRKAAARLMGLAFANVKLAGGLLSQQEGAAGRLAFLFYRQLESEAADEALMSQAVKCLVFLAADMYAYDSQRGAVPEAVVVPPDSNGLHAELLLPDGTLPLANGNGAAHSPAASAGAGEALDEGQHPDQDLDRDQDQDQAAAGEAEDDEAVDDGEGEQGDGGLSLHGLVRRVAKLADDRSYNRQQQRMAALRFTAALASRLGAPPILAYLPPLMRPLFRITESAAPNRDDVKLLTEEVIAHLRGVAGGDALINAFNVARRSVTTTRTERKRKQALQVLADPEAAAQQKLRKQARRAAGRKRKSEEMNRLRTAGIAVKNKRRDRAV
ncbi:hypothetical protein WJX72_012002 [[Myrmecia] bisecta]|uniref:Uncharacterized protein n=1 Tax=[Myrmecia] bisecta TaxID=41462 RepID=A0AAW1PXE7_9CHLO